MSCKDSDSDDERQDAALRPAQKRETNRKEEKEVMPAAALIAEREKFWNEYNRMEDEEKNQCNDPPAAEGSSKSSDRQDTGSDDAIKAVKALLKSSGSDPKISLAHPGLERLNKVDSPATLDAEEHVFQLCQFLHTSENDSDTLRLSTEEFRDLILEKNVILLDTFSSENRETFLKNIFILMAIAKDESMICACYSILFHYSEKWQISLLDLLDAFLIWGVSWDLFHCVGVKDGDCSLYDDVSINPTDTNVEKVLDYVCLQMKMEILPKIRAAGQLLRGIFITAVDSRFRCSPMLVKFRSCVCRILEQIDKTDWEDDEEVTKLCSLLYFPDIHHHNQAFYCITLLSGSKNDLTRPLHNYLATRLVRDIVGAENADNLVPSQCDLKSLLSLLDDHRSAIYSLDYDEQYVLISVVHSYVQQYDITPDDHVILRGYIDWILDLKANIRDSVTSPDYSHITSIIASIFVLWDGLSPQNNHSMNVD